MWLFGRSSADSPRRETGPTTRATATPGAPGTPTPGINPESSFVGNLDEERIQEAIERSLQSRPAAALALARGMAERDALGRPDVLHSMCLLRPAFVSMRHTLFASSEWEQRPLMAQYVPGPDASVPPLTAAKHFRAREASRRADALCSIAEALSLLSESGVGVGRRGSSSGGGSLERVRVLGLLMSDLVRVQAVLEEEVGAEDMPSVNPATRGATLSTIRALAATTKARAATITAATPSEQTWRSRVIGKTAAVGLALCLNIGTDPPDAPRVEPCARLQSWQDPKNFETTQVRIISFGGGGTQRTYLSIYFLWGRITKYICIFCGVGSQNTSKYIFFMGEEHKPPYNT